MHKQDDDARIWDGQVVGVVLIQPLVVYGGDVVWLVELPGCDVCGDGVVGPIVTGVPLLSLFI